MGHFGIDTGYSENIIKGDNNESIT